MKVSRQLKPFDGMIICSIVLLAIVIAAYFIVIQTSGAKKIIISQNNVVIKEYPLSATLNETLFVSGKYENTIILNEHGAKIQTTTCPDEFCKKKQPIFYNGQMIICLPNQLTIEIVGAEDTIDFVVG